MLIIFCLASDDTISVAAICPGPAHLSSSFNPPFFPSLWWTLHDAWTEPAHRVPKILMQFIQTNSLTKFTWMFNVFQKSAFMRAMYSSMALKSGEGVHIWTLSVRK